jgi:two-component system chemotaxis response regulator CheY
MKPKKKRVLIADDSLSLRTQLKQALLDAGLEVSAEASHGDEVVSLFASSRADVVLLDTQLPLKTGPEVLRALKKASPEARVVLLASVGEEALVEKLLGQGATDFMIRPVAAADAAQVIKRVADQP